MRKKDYKGRCEKRILKKCKEPVRTFDMIQYAGVDYLQTCEDVQEIRCNVLLDGEADGYMTDFLCVKTNGDYMVRECVQRKYLTKPLTVKLLDISRNYWLRHGVTDWGLMIDAEK